MNLVFCAYQADGSSSGCARRDKKCDGVEYFSAPFLFTRGKEIPTQTFSFSVRMRPEQDDRA
ncbi:hypothetical protein OPA78_002857 [Salmonella enterica subsp. enterica serovar Kentucky]|uniref:Uncharacterized protein n=1 Tax=Salmonella enterica TaxID=28901 RepID=A0A5U5KGR5_SALER|nr:hypothetical protein [Salmonella enterica]EIQ0623986.1 hypothetical protein [Salmonella enterica subsp. enterica]EAX0255231.1 hypothetical protein [Salmonella enterica]EAX1841386.1 hypothetical protein [Salmonella enterica subsp. enterica serovar Kentucky]EAY6690604.1 hypothetical protein [Salmonella enterica]EAZ3450734.1 hypothetical protein [Salmonella enterica]